MRRATAILLSSALFSLMTVPAVLAQPSTEPVQPQPAQPASVTFVRKAPAVGATSTESKNFSFDMNIEVVVPGRPAQKLAQAMSEVENRTLEVLAVNDVAPIKVKVAYKDAAKKQTQNGRGKEEASPLANKTYTVESKDGKLEITPAEGQDKLSDAERAELEKEFRNLGKREEFAKVIPEGEMKVGTVINVEKKLADELFNHGDENSNNEIPKFALTLTGTRTVDGRECGVFATELTMVTRPNEAMTITIKYTGEMLISTAEGFPVLMKLDGPVTIEGSNPQFSLNGDGKSTLSITATLAAPK